MAATAVKRPEQSACEVSCAMGRRGQTDPCWAPAARAHKTVEDRLGSGSTHLSCAPMSARRRMTIAVSSACFSPRSLARSIGSRVRRRSVRFVASGLFARSPPPSHSQRAIGSATSPPSGRSSRVTQNCVAHQKTASTCTLTGARRTRVGRRHVMPTRGDTPRTAGTPHLRAVSGSRKCSTRAQWCQGTGDISGAGRWWLAAGCTTSATSSERATSTQREATREEHADERRGR